MRRVKEQLPNYTVEEAKYWDDDPSPAADGTVMNTCSEPPIDTDIRVTAKMAAAGAQQLARHNWRYETEDRAVLIYRAMRKPDDRLS